MAHANSQKMKAAVCYEWGAPLAVEEVYLEPPGADEVQLAIKACAICHSDISAFQGHWAYETPLIAGHEASGVIEALGANVSGFAVEDRVVVSLLWSCQQCRHCLEDEPYLCIGDYSLERDSKLANREGTRLNRAFRVAGFAQYAVVHKTQIVRAPDSMTMAAASLLACGVITGLGAVVNTAQFKFGRSVAVIGCGGVGLNAVQGARLAGATQIIAVDIEPYKLEVAQSFGATHVVNARQTDAVAAVLDITDGGADYAFVVAGVPHLTEEAVRMTCKGGQAIQVGVPPLTSQLVFSGQQFTGQRSLKGSSMGGVNFRQDLPRLMRLYAQGRLKLDELVTKTYPLERINEAIADVEKGQTLRNVIVF